jgi:hypothetical protein
MRIKAPDYLSFVFVISGSGGDVQVQTKLSGIITSVFMIYKFLLIVVITFFVCPARHLQVHAQTISVAVTEQGSNQTRYYASASKAGGYKSFTYTGNRFRTGDQATGYSPVVDYALSPDGRFIGLLIKGDRSMYGVKILNSDGSLFQQHSDVMIMEAGDQSNKIFVHNDGSFTIRNNIAGFTLFNPGGIELNRVFNNSGSLRGEAVSELVQSRRGRQLAVYNPRIVTETGNQSRIQIIEGQELSHFHTFTEGAMIGLAISDNADRYVALVSGRSAGMLAVLDNSGRVQRKIDVMASPAGLFVSGNGRYAVVTRENRVELYDLASGDRVASTATRANVVFAHFDSDSDRLVMLAGSSRGRSGVLNNAAVYVINTAERSLLREQLTDTFHWDPEKLPLTLKTMGDLNWMLLGLNKPIRISVL